MLRGEKDAVDVKKKPNNPNSKTVVVEVNMVSLRPSDLSQIEPQVKRQPHRDIVT